MKKDKKDVYRNRKSPSVSPDRLSLFVSKCIFEQAIIQWTEQDDDGAYDKKVPNLFLLA